MEWMSPQKKDGLLGTAWVEQQGVLSRASRSPYDKLHRKAPKHDPVSLVHGPLCQRDSEDNDGMIFRLEVFLL